MREGGEGGKYEGGWEREGGREGREEGWGGEGGWGGVDGGREGREEGEGGRKGREERGDCYTYSNIIQWHHIILISVTYYVIT